jgi:hypothetical protein
MCSKSIMFFIIKCKWVLDICSTQVLLYKTRWFSVPSPFQQHRLWTIHCVFFTQIVLTFTSYGIYHALNSFIIKVVTIIIKFIIKFYSNSNYYKNCARSGHTMPAHEINKFYKSGVKIQPKSSSMIKPFVLKN